MKRGEARVSLARRRGSPDVFTHQMNLLELVAAILRERPEATAHEALALLAPNLLEAEPDDLFAAARFRAANARKPISYVDALGHVLTQKHGMAFLTGDKAFAKIEGLLLVVRRGREAPFNARLSPRPVAPRARRRSKRAAPV